MLFSLKSVKFLLFLKFFWCHNLLNWIRFILKDIVIRYTRFGNSQPASSFFRNNNYCFPDQGNVGHHTKNVTEKGYLLRLILCEFLLPWRHLLLIHGIGLVILNEPNVENNIIMKKNKKAYDFNLVNKTNKTKF